MPCKKCKDGKYKWGNTGECKYATKDECEKANPKKYSKMKYRPTPLGKKTYAEYAKELKEFNLSKVERVNLSLASDFNRDYSKAVKQSSVLAQEFAAIISEQNKLRDKVNKNISDFEKLEKPYNTILKQAKELGVNIDNVLKDRPNLPFDISQMKSIIKAIK